MLRADPEMEKGRGGEVHKVETAAHVVCIAGWVCSTQHFREGLSKQCAYTYLSYRTHLFCQ